MSDSPNGIAHEGRLTIVTINRPEAYNALNARAPAWMGR